MKYSIVVTMVECAVVEAIDAKHAQTLAMKFEGEVMAQHLTGKRGKRTIPVTASSQRVAVSGLDDPEGRILLDRGLL